MNGRTEKLKSRIPKKALVGLILWLACPAYGGTVEGNPVRDAFADRYDPDDNFGTCDFGFIRETIYFDGMPNDGEYYVCFDVSAPLGSTIDSANIILHATYGSNNGQPGTNDPTIVGFRTGSNWSEGNGCGILAANNELAWDDRPEVIPNEPRPMQTVISGDYPQTVSLDVTSLLPTLTCNQVSQCFGIRAIPFGASLTVTDGDYDVKKEPMPLPKLVLGFTTSNVATGGACDAIGACSFGSGGCLETTEADCMSISGGVYFGDTTSCDSVEGAEPVPTVSAWGLICLALAISVVVSLVTQDPKGILPTRR